MKRVQNFYPFSQNSCYQKIENYYPISDRYYNTFSSTYNKDSLKLYSRPLYESKYCECRNLKKNLKNENIRNIKCNCYV